MPAHGFLFIIDVKDATISGFLRGAKLWASIAKCDAKYFPGLLGAVCVVHSPGWAGWALKTCKASFLDRNTGDKIVMDSATDPVPGLSELLPLTL